VSAAVFGAADTPVMAGVPDPIANAAIIPRKSSYRIDLAQTPRWVAGFALAQDLGRGYCGLG